MSQGMTILVGYKPYKRLIEVTHIWNLKAFTVKPVLSGHSKIDKTKILMINGSLMKVESIAFCNTFALH